MGRAAPVVDPMALVGIALSGGYRIVRLIDPGGFGMVFEAVGPSGRRVALKVLQPEVVTEDTLSRLTREASVTSKIDNAHVVPILDAGHDLERDLAYLVMPLLEGTDVAALLAQTGPLSPDVAVRIALQAAAGLAAGHASGIIYRDIRPSRLFLEQRPGGEVAVRVFGVGLSKGFDPATSQPDKARSSGQHHGESGPRDDGADLRGDVFGLGATLYVMLSGASPWDEFDVTPDTESDRPGETLADSQRPHSAQFPSIQDRAPWIEAHLATAIALALHGDVDRRYPSIEAFAEALSALGNGEDLVTGDMLKPLDPALRDAIATRADAETDPLVGRELGGRYGVRRLIGRGGMGAVYEAEAPDGRRVAAKIIFKSAVGQDDQAVRRFIREARAVTSIHSPHVVKTFELGTDLTLASPFIVMELLTGIDLAKLLRMRGPLEPIPVVRVFIQAARGLAAAHVEGIVHRDIKPANLFLHAPMPTDGVAAVHSLPNSMHSPPMSVRPNSTRSPPISARSPASSQRKITVKVCDFGIAKRADDITSHELTRVGGVLGSPIYMSPEQAKRAKDVDLRSDIWSLSISLYQALCGSCPWDPNASLAELLLAICTDPVPPLGEAAPWLSPALVADVHRGLDKDQAKRWQTMEEMIAALERHANGSDAVTLDQLRGIDSERRALATPVSKLRPARSGDAQERSVDGSSFTAVQLPRGTMRRRVVGAAFALGALTAIGGIVALRAPGGERASAHGSDGAERIPSATPAAPADIPARITTSVSVPSGAVVRIDGALHDVVDGKVNLAGKAGDMFNVEVTHAGTTRREVVFVLGDGRAHPDHLDVDAPAPPAAGSAARTEPAARVERPRRDAASKPPVSAVPAGPAALPPSNTVAPVDRW